MYTVDKNKDYYDYLSHVYGEDKKITFDRRGSVNIDDTDIAAIIDLRRSFHDWNGRKHIILEVGNTQYLIELSKFKTKPSPAGNEEFVSCKMKVIWIFKNNTHYYDSVMSIRQVAVKSIWDWKGDEKRKLVLSDNFQDSIESVYEHHIDLPILAKTQITKLIPGEDIWKELQNYISGLDNDKDISIPMTDVEKAETHGFDKKTSFRHPVK